MRHIDTGKKQRHPGDDDANAQAARHATKMKPDRITQLGIGETIISSIER